jgi:hypothetical protein
MTLTSGGELHIKGDIGSPTRSIEYEVEGSILGDASLSVLSAGADPSVGSLPTNMTDFYGHTQTEYGRCFGESASTLTAYMRRLTEGSYYTITAFQGEAQEFSADRDESVALYKTNTGTPFVSGDNVNVVLYRREKNTAFSWSSVTSWGTYVSASYNCIFSTYDYKWVISDNA